jgi:hypothetical protein
VRSRRTVSVLAGVTPVNVKYEEGLACEGGKLAASAGGRCSGAGALKSARLGATKMALPSLEWVIIAASLRDEGSI